MCTPAVYNVYTNSILSTRKLFFAFAENEEMIPKLGGHYKYHTASISTKQKDGTFEGNQRCYSW